ncbi:MAG TPA: hypothetical protein VMF68_04360 [Spirochaetia bacterium]|nr:hypothetical protein [Spirochaetia bacterium]
MNNRFSWVVLLASGMFFLFIVGLTGFRTEDVRRRNAAAAREGASALAAKAHSLADTIGSTQSPAFKSAMRTVFDADPRLLLVSLHTPADGMVYFIGRSPSALKEPATITPQWRGTPSYRVNRGSELLVSAGMDTTVPGMTMDALYVIMGREDLYPIVRDDLYFFLAFLLVCGVAILIVMSIEPDIPSPGTRGGTAPVEPAGRAPGARAPESPAPAAHSESPAGLVSPRTGLVWSEHLPARLAAELERAASSDTDLSFAMVRIDDPFADSRLPAVYTEIARVLKESFPLHDLIFESSEDSYCLLLPDTDLDSAVRQLDEMRARLAGRAIEGRARALSIGVSSRGGRLIEDQVLRNEAQVAVAKAGREGGNQVVGFRADPSRFREALAGRAG